MKRNTRQRDLIKEIYISASRPLSPAEAALLAQKNNPTLGIATVYRAVKDLQAEGWLISVMVGGCTRFECATKHHHHHHHFHCQSCDQVFDVPGCTSNIDRLVPSGFIASSHELTINGYCDSCALSSGLTNK